ncbi:MAG TPA: sigma-70 family RNA polymerase sigma factor [Acidobacteriaceae bacterium]|nr:sigma-70 family RNA polymerase sigma factor [Acidobacteriaceae bacterium]
MVLPPEHLPRRCGPELLPHGPFPIEENGVREGLQGRGIGGEALSRPAETDAGIAALVETWSTLLFRVAHSVLRNPTEAEDVVQDTFVRVMEHKQKIPAIRHLRVWLVRITWNLALDRRRRIRPDQLDDASAHAIIARNAPADAALDDARELARVFREIDRLPRAERQALLLSAIDELDTRELAQVLNKSESAIRALIFRARARLRQRLTKGGQA